MATQSSDNYSSSNSSGYGTGTGSGPAPFLEELEARGFGVQEFHTADAESRVLSSLADETSKDLADMMCGSGCIPLGQLLETVTRLENFGLILRSGAKGDERYSLSSSGIKTAQMMGVYRGR